MKRIISLLLLIFASNCILAQTQVTYVKTPLNSPVIDAWELGEQLNSTQKAALSDSITLNYPNATEVNPPSATTYYNCHTFAWYRSEGGTGNVWIGWIPGRTAEDIYWNDGSFIEVTTLDEASKISYDNEGTGDHSAIKLSGTNCRSKWGPWPLVDHAVGYGPYIYNMSIRKYYNSFKVTASKSVLCYGSTATFSTPDYVNCTFNWTYNSNLLNYVSGQGTKTFVVEPKYSYSKGEAWVKLELTIHLNPDVKREITKEVWVGKPQIYAYGSHIVDVNTGMPVYDLCYGTSNDVEAVHPAGDAGITDWDWQVSYGQVYPYGMLDQYATIYPNDYQSFMLEIRACNTCGYSDWTHMYTNVVNCGRFLLIFTPNPTTGETTLSIESESEEKAFDDTAEWEMEIYSESQLLKEKKTSLRGKSTKIQTQGWKEGVYMVRVNYRDKILTGKLVVKK